MRSAVIWKSRLRARDPVELIITPPAGWRVDELPRRCTATAPGGQLSLSWSTSLVRLPRDTVKWRWRTLRADTPKQAAIVALHERAAQTVDGWELFLAEIDVCRDGAMIERRLGAFYVFLEHAALVMVRATSGSALDAHRDSIVDALQRARPRFRDDPGVAPAAFWRPFTPPTER